jgi:hypothetical protein
MADGAQRFSVTATTCREKGFLSFKIAGSLKT